MRGSDTHASGAYYFVLDNFEKPGKPVVSVELVEHFVQYAVSGDNKVLFESHWSATATLTNFLDKNFAGPFAALFRISKLAESSRVDGNLLKVLAAGYPKVAAELSRNAP